MTSRILGDCTMKKAENDSFKRMRWFGLLLTIVAWLAFLVSFFLPAAVQVGSMAGAPLSIRSGWQTFLESYTVPFSEGTIGHVLSQPLMLLCFLSPLPNGLMLLAPLANMRLKHYAAVYGAFLFFSGTAAIWVCMDVYEGISAGFYLWITSIFVTALASFLISGSWLMKDNEEHERALEELRKVLP